MADLFTTEARRAARAAPNLGELLARLEERLGHWDSTSASAAIADSLAAVGADPEEQPAAPTRERRRGGDERYSQWTLRRVGEADYEIRVIDGSVGRGGTLVDAVSDLLAWLS